MVGFLAPSQVIAASAQVDAAAHEMRVRKQVFDSRDLLKKSHEWPRVQVMDRAAQCRWKALFTRAGELFFDRIDAELLPGHGVIRPRK